MDHLSASEVAAYLDRTLPALARERADRHLSDCADCREELVACTRLVQSAPTTRRRFVAPALGVIAAVVVVAIALRARPTDRLEQQAIERASGPAGPEVRLVAPRNGSAISSGALRFTWRADSGAVGYRIVVTTPTGTLVWRGEPHDTTVVPPPGTKFVNGGEFYWRVESTRADGGGATSGASAFRVVDR